MKKENYHRDEDYKKYEGLFENMFLKRLNLISRFVKKGRMLEIGSSTGVMLKLFTKRGWDALGVEPSGSSREAKKKGLRVLNVKFEDSKLPNDYFDLVVLNHTLEHMDNSRQVLKKINIDKITSTGPSIVQEVLFKAHLKGFRIKEIPIIFKERKLGTSKLGIPQLFGGYIMVLKLKLLDLFNAI